MSAHDMKRFVTQLIEDRVSLIRNLDNLDIRTMMILHLMCVDARELLRLPKRQSIPFVESAVGIGQDIQEALIRGRSFLIPPHESATINAAYGHYPDTLLLPHDVISPRGGFAYFSEPLKDPQEGAPPIQAILWKIESDDSAVAGHIYKKSCSPTPVEPNSVLCLVSFTRRDHVRAPHLDAVSSDSTLVPSASILWHLGHKDGHPAIMGNSVFKDFTLEEIAAMAENRTNHIKILLTLFSCLRRTFETTSHTGRVPADKKIDKVARRHPKISRGIDIVRFRPRKASSSRKTAQGKWKLTKQHPTPGFWRLQPFPKEGRKDWILIEGFLRGPKGTEVVNPERILLPPLSLEETIAKREKRK